MAEQRTPCGAAADLESEALEVTQPRAGVALVRIVSEPLGVQRNGVRRALRARLAELEATPETRCLVITGSGRAFSVGSDIREFRREPGWLLEAQSHRARAVSRPGRLPLAGDRRVQRVDPRRRIGAGLRLRHPHRCRIGPLRRARGQSRYLRFRKWNAAPSSVDRSRAGHDAPRHWRDHRRCRGLAPRTGRGCRPRQRASGSCPGHGRRHRFPAGRAQSPPPNAASPLASATEWRLASCSKLS